MSSTLAIVLMCVLVAFVVWVQPNKHILRFIDLQQRKAYLRVGAPWGITERVGESNDELRRRILEALDEAEPKP